jgi:glycerophosphoryl diester phosphodiesterase
LTVFAPDWLSARPIAHRGLHDRARGVIENSFEAAEAAAAAGFAIECDVQLSRDGEAMVFHDDRLDRLTGATGLFGERDADELGKLTLRGGASGVPRLTAFLARIGARTPLVCEIKSDFKADMRLVRRVMAVTALYQGQLAFKSFDPDVIAFLRDLAPRAPDGAPRPLGIVAMATYDASEWPDLSDAQRDDCASFAHVQRTRPDFVSFNVDDLPHAAPRLLKSLTGAPAIAWTVASAAQRVRAQTFADQIVFEGAGRP